MAQNYIADLSEEARAAEISEEGERIRDYERSRANLIARDSRKSANFPCDYPGCLEMPFNDQSLLKYGNRYLKLYIYLTTDSSHAKSHREGQIATSSGLSRKEATEEQTLQSTDPGSCPIPQPSMNPSIPATSVSYSTAALPGLYHMDPDRGGTTSPLPIGMPNDSLITGAFKCEHAGCTAPPFETQYQLK